MSRFFRYKTAQDLCRDAEAWGIGLRLESELGSLFSPVQVGGKRVGNRLAIQPMEGCDCDLDGAPGELTFRRFGRFGAGGAKLIWGEACAVVPEGRANPRQLVINERNMAALGRLLEHTRQAHRAEVGADDDLLVGLQLTHSGRYSHQKPILAQHDPVLDSLTLANKATRRCADASDALIDDDALSRLQDTYVAAARLAQRAGFDFVDIKQCHRYLLNELLGARTRPGRFGGSFENRTRFALELFRRIREACPGLLLATRLNVFDGPPFVKAADGVGAPAGESGMGCWGTRLDDARLPDLTEPLAYIGMLVDVGVCLVNVSMGNPYASPHILRPFEYPPPDGYLPPEHPLVGVARHFDLTSEVQGAYPELAVVGSGYSWLQGFALQAGAANVDAGRTTFVGLGRGALADPEFARRAQSGQAFDPRKTCRTFSYCTALMRSKHNALGQFATGCPPFDKEVYGPIWKEARDQE